MQAEDEYDIGSDARDGLIAHNLTNGCIRGCSVEQRPNGDDFVLIELLPARLAEFGQAIREALGQIPFEFDEVQVQSDDGVFYAPPPSGTSWWARRRDARRRRRIVQRQARRT